MGEWRYSSTILDLGTIWRRVVSFTSRPLYPRGKNLWYPLNRRLGEPQSRYGRCEEEQNLVTCISVTRDGFIGLFDTARDYTLQFTITHTHTLVSSHVFISRCSVAASNGWRSPSSGFPNYPRSQLPASNSNSSQGLNPSSPLTHSLTHSLTNHLLFTSLTLNCPAYNISARTTQKPPFLCCCLRAAS
jgi:hypothetical protein